MSDFTVSLRFTADGSVQVVNAARQTAEAVTGVGKAAQTSGDKADAAFKQQVRAIGELRAEAVQTQSTVASLLGVIGGGAALIGFGRSFISAADGVGQLQARLKLATADHREYEAVLDRIQQVARNSYKSVADISEVFLQSAGPMKELGFSTQDTLDLTEAMSLALVVSGANAQNSSSAIAQLGQAMQLGTLRGEEFNTVVAAAPRFADALATALGKTRQELKQMADDGELTIDQVAAVSSQLELLRAETESMPTTVEDAMVRARDAFGFWAAGANDASSATGTLVQGIDLLSDNIETVMTAALVGATAVTGHLVKQGYAWVTSLLAQQQASRAASAAAVEQAAALVAETQASVRSAQVNLARAQSLRAMSVVEAQSAGFVVKRAQADIAAAQAAGLRATSEVALARASIALTAAETALGAARGRAALAGQQLAAANASIAASERALAVAQGQAAEASRVLDGTTKAATGSILSFSSAINVAMVALVAWQIGTWARNEFEIVRVAAVYLVAALDQQWQSAKLAATVVWEGIRGVIVGQINIIRTVLADLLGIYASMGEKLDLTGLYSAFTGPLREFEAQLRPTESAWDRFTSKLSIAQTSYVATAQSIWEVAKGLVEAERNATSAAAAQEEFARTGTVNTRTLDLAVAALNKRVGEQTVQMSQQVATYNKGRAAMVEYQKSQEIAATTAIKDATAREAMVAAINAAYAPLIKEARAFDALAVAKKNDTKESKDWERETKRLADTQAAFADTLLQMEAALSGPVRKAQIDYQVELKKLDKQVETGEITLIQYYDALELVERGHRNATAAAEAQEDVAGQLQLHYAEEVRLMQMTEQQRQVELATLDALRRKREQNGGVLTALEEQNIRAIVARGEAEVQAAEMSRQAAEAASQYWWQFSGDLATAFRQGGDAVEDHFKRMLENLKQQLLQSAIFGLIKQLFGGATSGAGGGFWSSLVGAFTGGGGATSGGGFLGMISAAFAGGGSSAASAAPVGSTAFSGLGQAASAAGQQMWGSFTNAASGNGPSGMGGATPWLAALGGAVYGFQNAGSGGLSSAAAGIAYGGLAYTGAVIGAGALAGAGAATAATAGAGLYAGASAAVGGAAAGASTAAMAIPVVGWILAILAIIDIVAGGKLFGTRYKPKEATSSLSIGPEGSSAALSVFETRQGALFSGLRRRTRELDPGEEALEAAQSWWDSMMEVNRQAATALQAEGTDLLEMTLRTVQEFGQGGKGKVKSEKLFLDVLGRSFEVADAEEAMVRAAAEQMIYVIDQVLGATTEAITDGLTIGGILESEAGTDTGTGPAADAALPDVDAAGPGLGSNIEKVAQVMGEASQIAERWRGNTEELMAGAQFLLAAAGDMVRGVGLLGDGPGSLTRVTELIEELAQAGEPLLDAYMRVAASTRLLEDATQMMGVSLDLRRDEFVRFATEIAEAAGGLDRASALWQDYFNRFFSPEERAEFGRDRAVTFAQDEFGDIDLDFADFAGDGGGEAFRELFESVLPTLSADMVVEWLEAANALGVVLDAEAALTQARGGAADTASALANMMAAVQAESDAVAQQLADLGMSELALRLRSIDEGMRSALETARELGAGEEELSAIRQLAADQSALAMAVARIELDQLLGGLRFDESLQGMTELDQQIARLNRTWDETIANATALGATQDELAEIEAYRAAGIGRLIAAEEAAADARAEAELRQFQADWEARMRLEADNAQRLRELLANLAWEDSLRGLTAYERQIAETNKRYNDLVTQARELGAAFYQINAIEESRAAALQEIAAAEAARLAEQIGGVLDPLRWDASLRGLTAIERQQMEINRRFDQYQNTLIEAGASAEQLAELEIFRQQALVDLVDQRYEREMAWIARLETFRDSLLLDSNLTTLTPAEQLAEAQSQYESTLAAALAGDESAQSALEGISRQYLDLAREFFGSATGYQDIFDQVLGDIGSIIDAPVGRASVEQTVTEALQTIASSPLFAPGEDGQAPVLVDVAPVTSSIDGLRDDTRDQTRQVVTELRSIRARLDTIESNTGRTASNTQAMVDIDRNRTD